MKDPLLRLFPLWEFSPQQPELSKFNPTLQRKPRSPRQKSKGSNLALPFGAK
jgi:hypothetical protein